MKNFSLESLIKSHRRHQILNKQGNFYHKNYSNLKNGSMVRLKTGGPLMTIERIQKNNGNTDLDPWYAICAYFKNNELIREEIKLVALKIAPLAAFE